MNVENVLIVDCGTEHIKELEEVVESIGLSHSAIGVDDFSREVCEIFTKIIISGSPALVTETNQDETREKYTWIKDIDTHILGICYGHQLLGLAYGERVYRGSECRELLELQLHQNDILFSKIARDREIFMMREDHTEGVGVPEGFVPLAYSAVYENEAMRHPEKFQYGVQFHPEVSGKAGQQLMRNFLNL